MGTARWREVLRLLAFGGLLGGAAAALPDFEENPSCVEPVSLVVQNGNFSYMPTDFAVEAVDAQARRKLSLFWTIGPGEVATDVVHEQTEMLHASGLSEALRSIYVNGLDHNRQSDGHDWQDAFRMVQQAKGATAYTGDLARAVDAIEAKVQPVKLSKESTAVYNTELVPSFEFPALEALWDHCQRRPDDYVAYVHTKGSGTLGLHDKNDSTQGKGKNEYWRQILGTAVLDRWRTCVNALDAGYDTCGPLLQNDWAGVLWPHYSGNFFWATCRYIQTRTSPQPTAKDLETAVITGTRPQGRFLAEAWLMDQSVPAAATSTFRHYNMYGTPNGYFKYHSGSEADMRDPTSRCRKLPPSDKKAQSQARMRRLRGAEEGRVAK